MKNASKLAERIPAEYRKEILELNLISEAQAIPSDPAMSYLVIIFQNYFEATFRPNCNSCCSRCLDVFKAMLPHLIELEKENKALTKI